MAWSNLLYRCRVLLSGIMVALLLSLSAGANAQERTNYQFGTATTSELSHAVGVTLAALVKLKLLPVAGIDINARNTLGSRDNVRLLQAGDLDFAILNSLDARNALIDLDAADGGEPDSGLRMLTNLWREGYYVVARKDLVPGGTFDEFLALRGIKVAFGERGSDHFTSSQALFQAFDVAVDEAFEVLNLGSQAAAAAFLRGELDAFILTSGTDHSELLSFLEKAGDSAMLLSVSEEDLDAANGRGPEVWSGVDLPPDSYAGQPAGQKTFAISYLLAATAAVDDGAVYQITKTIFDNLPVLQGMHSATDSISLENALQRIVLPIHPGAERYYGEIGIEVPVLEPVRVSNLAGAGFLARFSTIQEARLRLTDGNVSILGGQDGETIGRFTSELANSLPADTLRVMGMTSPDPANNIAQVLYAKGVDTAFVPLDILNYADRENVYPGMKSKLVYTTELFPEEFHLITTSAIDDIEDLADKPVNLGTRGSGSAFTASFLFDHLNIPIQATYLEPRKALDLLKNGELAAVVMVSGKPSPLLQEVGITDGLRLLSVPVLDGDAYRPTTITALDYADMLDAGETVETFAVRTALVTYRWRTDNPRYATIAAFVAAFFDKLSSLKEDATGLHPKWSDINPFAELDGWERFSAAEDWLNKERSAVRSDGNVDG